MLWEQGAWGRPRAQAALGTAHVSVLFILQSPNPTPPPGLLLLIASKTAGWAQGLSGELGGAGSGSETEPLTFFLKAGLLGTLSFYILRETEFPQNFCFQQPWGYSGKQSCLPEFLFSWETLLVV